MSEFKQIIGRGTRLRDDYGKLWFNILDYTGSATRMFADPSFDGDPVKVIEEQVNENGDPTSSIETTAAEFEEPEQDDYVPEIVEPPDAEHQKFYFDGGQVEIVAHLVHELDPNGKQLRVVRYTDYAAETIRILCRRRRSCANDGRTSSSTMRLSPRSPSGASASRNWPSKPNSPRPIPSTYSATWHSMHRSAPGESGRSAYGRIARTFSSDTVPRPVRSLTNCLRSTPSTGTHNSCCRMCSTAADFRTRKSRRNHSPVRQP